MTHDEILAYSLKLPGAFVDYPFGPDDTIIKVKSENGPARIFVMLFTLKGEPKATFKCDARIGGMYRAEYPDAVTRGYHCPPVQQPYFNTVSLSGTVPDDELAGMIDHAWAAAVAKMPKKYQNELHKA